MRASPHQHRAGEQALARYLTLAAWQCRAATRWKAAAWPHAWLAVLLLSGLGACSTVRHPSTENSAQLHAYAQRVNQISTLNNWSLDGRLAISDSKDGGSGRLQWQQHDSATHMSFRGTMGKGAWQLHADPAGARLELANGEMHTAATLNELIFDQIGWRVPVSALSWWVRGLAQPEPWQSRTLDEAGRLSSLVQNGWNIEFDRYQSEDHLAMPEKLTARRGDYSIKLVVKDWQWPGGAGGLE